VQSPDALNASTYHGKSLLIAFTNLELKVVLDGGRFDSSSTILDISKLLSGHKARDMSRNAWAMHLLGGAKTSVQNAVYASMGHQKSIEADLFASVVPFHKLKMAHLIYFYQKERLRG
jgi:hypothetical protein